MGRNFDDHPRFQPKTTHPNILGGSVDVQIVYFMDENLAQFNRKYYLVFIANVCTTISVGLW